MRSIEVDADVFAKIWSHRLDGEQSENDILRRLLIPAPAATKAKADVDATGRRTPWRDDVRAALTSLGGEAHLSAIYRAVRIIRLREGRSLPPTADVIVRRELENNCAQAKAYTGRHDWFRMPEGKGAGVWALRKKMRDNWTD